MATVSLRAFVPGRRVHATSPRSRGLVRSRNSSILGRNHRPYGENHVEDRIELLRDGGRMKSMRIAESISDLTFRVPQSAFTECRLRRSLRCELGEPAEFADGPRYFRVSQEQKGSEREMSRRN